MSIESRGTRKQPAYQVRVRPFRAVTVPTLEAARALELDLKLRKKLGHLYTEKPITLGDAIDGFLERKETLGGKRGPLRGATLDWYRRSTLAWEPLRSTHLPNLRRVAVEDLAAARARTAPDAAKDELQVLKTVLREAESRGQRFDPAILDIPAIRRDEREGVALTVDELDALASWAPEHIKRIITFCGLVGLRFTEALTLTDDRVDLDAPSLLIPTRLNKSKRPKAVDLSAMEAQLLREQMLVRKAGARVVFATRRGRRYSESSFRDHVWWPALDAAGLRGSFRFHDLRHTAISLSARAGIPAEVIAERVGHSDGGALIRRRYRHLFPGEAASKVALLDELVRAERAAADPRRVHNEHRRPHG